MRGQQEILIDLLRRSTGTDISAFHPDYIRKLLHRRAALLANNDVSAYIDILERDQNEVSELLSLFSNTYTEFFRDTLTSAFLEQSALPSLIDKACSDGKRSLRMWSAGCSTGQEVWSLAMLLDTLITARSSDCGFHIFATDTNIEALDVARRARYDRTALQAVRLGQFDAFFTAIGPGYEIVPRLRSRVDFEVYDVLDPAFSCPPSCIYGDLDMVICANVLYYYRDDVRHSVLEKIHRCLSPSGLFVTGESEREFVAQSRLFRKTLSRVSVFSPIKSA
jgi:chemotaxis methyl-accepting protein methylase